MSDHSMRNWMALLGGAGIGALAMYMCDPEKGEDRRQRLSAKAAGATRATTEALGSAMQGARERAGNYRQAASAGLSALGSTLAQRASYLKAHLPDGQTARRLVESGYRLGRRGQREMVEPRRPAMRGLAGGLMAAGCIALGVGAMYFMDAESGARRRAKARNRIVYGYDYVAGRVQEGGRELWNRASHMGSEVAMAEGEEILH